jgi:hypothetical protein
METVFTVIVGGMGLIAITLCNTLLYLGVKELLPPNKKMMHLIALLPPMGLITVFIVSIIFIFIFIKNTIQEVINL